MNGLHRQLSSFGVLLLTLSSLSPVLSVYGVGGAVLQQAGTGSVGLFLLGLAAAVVWALVYAELGSAFPYAGGDYVGVGRVLGGWAGLVTLAVWAASAGPATAFEAQVIATYAGVLLPGMAPMAITFIALAGAVGVALLAVRMGALVTGLFLAVEMLAVAVLIGAGFWHPARGLGEVLTHPLMPGAGGALVPETFAVFALAMVSTVYGTVGGNQALYFGEELGEPHRRMGPVVIIACMTVAVLATPLLMVAPVEAALTKRLATFNNIQQDGSYQSRAYLYQNFTASAFSEPIGIGFGGNGAGTKLAETSTNGFDSGFLQIPYQFGWVFGALFCWALIVLMLRALAAALRRDDNIRIAAAGMFLTMIALNAAAPMFAGVLGVITWVSLGIALGPKA